jgi:hypothetical protein
MTDWVVSEQRFDLRRITDIPICQKCKNTYLTCRLARGQGPHVRVNGVVYSIIYIHTFLI